MHKNGIKPTKSFKTTYAHYVYIECMRGAIMVDARVKLSKYSNRVIGVVKAKYDLNDKSDALNKFIELYGENEVEPEVKEEYVKKILKISEDHIKKYGYKSMTKKELDELFGK